MITTQADLETALLAGGDIDVDSSATISLSTPMQVDVPTRLRGGRFVRDTGPAFEVTSPAVELDGMQIIGGGTSSGYDATQKLIYAHGTALDPLLGVRVQDCALSESRGDNVWLEWCAESFVESNHVADYLYSGVMLVSGQRVRVAGNIVTDAALSDGVLNVYGIAVTDLSNTDGARSRDCSVVGNHVSLIDWEGIDTHGGDRLTVVGNHVLGCPSGIAVVTGNPTRLFAPTNCLVDGNTISAAGARVPLRGGVNIVGVAGRPASATVVGNQILGYDGHNPIFASYWDRDDTYVGGNSRPFVPWTAIQLGADYTANATYPPQYSVDGNTVEVRGGIIPKSGGVAVRDDVGSVPNAAAWPGVLTIACFVKGSNPGAGNGQVAVYPDGTLKMLYGAGNDGFTYWLSGSYPVP